MSASLASQPSKPHDIFDDLESLLWVMLFYAIRNFKFRGHFDMRLFKEGTQVPDEKLGVASVGGSLKFSWIQRSEIIFECKPLQDFFTSFRSFHREHYWKRAAATPGEESQNELDAFEAKVYNDVYALLSHFDDILGDADADWTGQESHHVLQEVHQDPGQDVPQPAGADEPLLVSHPEVPSQQSEGTKGARKRKRGDSEDNKDRRKRVATSQLDDVQGSRRVARCPRRRRAPIVPTPSDRTLRPRTGK